MPPPARIASLLASATEMLFGLGLGDRVVAVSHECDWPPEACTKPRVTRTAVDASASSRAIDTQVQSMLQGGESLYAIDEPRLAALAPDLIVTQAQCDVCAVRYADVLAAVARHDRLRDARVVALNPQSMGDVLADIERVARAAEVEDAGMRYVATLQARIDAVKARAADAALADRPRVALIEWTDPLMLSGNWMPELVEWAGGRHDLTQTGEHSPYVSWPQLQEYDPQVVLVVPCGFDLPRAIHEAQLLQTRPEWAQLDAVRRGRVWAVDGAAYFNRSGPRLVDSLEILAHLIHPERSAAPAALADIARRI